MLLRVLKGVVGTLVRRRRSLYPRRGEERFESCARIISWTWSGSGLGGEIHTAAVQRARRMGTGNHPRRDGPLETSAGYSRGWTSNRNLSSGKRRGAGWGQKGYWRRLALAGIGGQLNEVCVARLGGLRKARTDRSGRWGWWDRQRSWVIEGASAYLRTASREKGGEGDSRYTVGVI